MSQKIALYKDLSSAVDILDCFLKRRTLNEVIDRATHPLRVGRQFAGSVNKEAEQGVTSLPNEELYFGLSSVYTSRKRTCEFDVTFRWVLWKCNVLLVNLVNSLLRFLSFSMNTSLGPIHTEQK